MALRGIGFAVVTLSMGITACGKEPDARRDLTQREKDSILGASQIPGAKAVKRSLTSADSANARQSRLDSAEKEP